MLMLIGSVAAQLHGLDLGRKPRDVDAMGEYDDVKALYDPDYVIKFYDKVANGEVAPYTGP